MTPLLCQVTDAAATDTVWQLEATWRYAPWLTLIALLAIAGIVATSYARELSPAGRGYRFLLGGLRLLTIAMLLAMLSELLFAGTKFGRPRFAVLLDCSGSMGIRDSLDASDTSAASLQSASGRDSNRLSLAKMVLSQDGHKILSALEREYDVTLYASSDHLELIEAGPRLLRDVVIDDQAPSTRLGDSIQGVLRDSTSAPQGILVLTDGQVTQGASLRAAAESARRTATPLYIVGIGSEDAPPDISLTELLAEEVVFVDDLVSFRATVRTTASVSGPVRIALRRDGQEQVIAEKNIEAPKGGGATPVQLNVRHEKPGVYRYSMTADVLEGELNQANNTTRHEVAVRDGQIRVLLASGGPTYEFRYLKHLLERDSTVKLTSLLQDADLDYAAADPSAVSRLPLRDFEFDKYDAVVLIDLDPRLAPRTFWPGLRRFVSEEGGGLTLVAGPNFLPQAYKGISDFAALYPAELSAADAGGRLSTATGFRLQPTPLGLQSSAMQLGDDAEGSRRLWRRLPELYWWAQLGKLKPAARTLATHPRARTPDGRPAPLLVSQFYGSGTVVLHGVDATYRWRRRVGDAYFARYWIQLLRSLARGRLEDNQRGQLTVDQQRYEPGQAVRLRFRLESQATGGVAVLLQPESGPQRRVVLEPSAEARGLYEATLEQLPVGSYRVLPANSALLEKQTAEATFQVTPPAGEFADLRLAKDALQAAAQRTGGLYVPWSRAQDLLDSLPPARRMAVESLPPVELWNRWWMLAGVCGCLTTEWILRKRRAML